jgi:hypothetical protein
MVEFAETKARVSIERTEQVRQLEMSYERDKHAMKRLTENNKGYLSIIWISQWSTNLTIHSSLEC